MGEQTYTELRGHNFALTADFDAVKTEDYEGLFITGGRAPEYIRLNARCLTVHLGILADFEVSKDT